jgi:hypothetical protein
MSELSNSERETHINMVADDRSVWAIFSDDPVMIRKLERVGAVLIRTVHGGGKHYTLPANQISFRNPPRVLSDEERAAKAASFAARLGRE